MWVPDQGLCEFQVKQAALITLPAKNGGCMCEFSEFTVNLQPVAVRQAFELVGNQERFGFLVCFLGPATLLAAGVWQPGGLGLPRPAGKPEGADPLLQTAS